MTELHREELDWLRDNEHTLQHLAQLQYRNAELFNAKLSKLSEQIEGLRQEVMIINQRIALDKARLNGGRT